MQDSADTQLTGTQRIGAPTTTGSGCWMRSGAAAAGSGGWLLWALAVLVARLPKRHRIRAGAILGALAGSVLRIRRKHVETAMRHAGIRSAPAEARNMYRSLGISAFEFLQMAGGGDHDSPGMQLDAAALQVLEHARDTRRGIVFAASHTGNWDRAACAIAARMELLVITKRLSVQRLDAFWQHVRATQRVHLAGADGALERARPVLARGGAVAMMIDQVPAARTGCLSIPFLGQPVWVERGPAVLAARAQVPLAVCASRRTESGDHVFTVLAVFDPPLRGRAAWIDEVTRRATQALETFIRAYPSQWLWMHRRWRDPSESRNGQIHNP